RAVEQYVVEDEGSTHMHMYVCVICWCQRLVKHRGAMDRHPPRLVVALSERAHRTDIVLPIPRATCWLIGVLECRIEQDVKHQSLSIEHTSALRDDMRAHQGQRIAFELCSLEVTGKMTRPCPIVSVRRPNKRSFKTARTSAEVDVDVDRRDECAGQPRRTRNDAARVDKSPMDHLIRQPEILGLLSAQIRERTEWSSWCGVLRCGHGEAGSSGGRILSAGPE